MAAQAGTAGVHGQGSARRGIVSAASQAWIEKLIDTTRRNNLLYFRDLKTGSLDLDAAAPDELSALLQGETVAAARLTNEEDRKRTSAMLANIGRRALSNREEKGLETLFLALGMATWEPSDGGRPPSSPVLLVPIELKARGRAGSGFELRRDGEYQFNPVLAHVLETDYGCRLDPSELLADDDGEDDTEPVPVDPDIVFDRLRRAASKVPRFEVGQRAVVSNFSFQKMAMVQDLRLYGDALAENDLIAAMAGDLSARQALSGVVEDVDPRELDRQPVGSQLLIMDADSSQQSVIETVRRGQSCVIQGPPGTGKSQTIANLIAVLAAEGRRVLFVAEKRAALDVVQARLERVGLGRLVLDLHGADISRKEILKRVAASLEAVGSTLPTDGHGVEERLQERRQRLNDYVRALHVPRKPTEISVYEMQGRLLRLPVAVQSPVRWRGPELTRLDAATAQRIRDRLQEVSGLAGLVTGTDTSPWTGAGLADAAAATGAIDLALQVDRLWESVSLALQAVQSVDRDLQPESLHDLYALSHLLSGLNSSLALYRSEVWGEDLDSIVEALKPAAKSALAAIWASVFDARFKAAVDTMRSLRNEQRVDARRVQVEARAIRDQLKSWRVLLGQRSEPATMREADPLYDALAAFQPVFSRLEAVLAPGFSTGVPLEALGQRLKSLAEDSTTPHRIPQVLAIEKELESSGAGAVVAEIRNRKPEPELWSQVFDYAWLRSSLETARAEEPILATFSGTTQNEIVAEFRRLDQEALKVAVSKAQRKHAEHVITAMNGHKDQEYRVRHEAQKKSRHMPIRKLLAEAPDVLLALFPCWMASPLSVSQLIGGDRRYFDVVLFDEASQVLPQDAVPSILRGSRVAVAGDAHQLPPTTFFADGTDDEDSESDDALMSEGFESLLDQLSSFLPSQSLDWHYRSLDETLIAFSNRHIYNERLVTFPGPGGGEPSVHHVLVPFVTDTDGQEESASAEVRKVVELVLEHATERPEESLGVIAMGLPHAKRVEAAIDDALRNRPELDAFFDPTRRERFFVKNLERVQGDERDAVIVTVGYGKDRGGNLPHRFGPLNNAGGERRLNVAVTRARRRMTVVSSFDHHDVDPARSRARGVELLKLFLEFAATHGRHLGDTELSEVPMNPFEEDVFNALERAGIDLVPQLGASRYRLDFAVKDPQKPGRYVLAIECDGATYHSAPTARDRDRLRQQQLEALGWRFHRIWSTDWFTNRDAEVQRTLEAYQKALRVGPAAPPNARPQAEKLREAEHEPSGRAVRKPLGPRPQVPHKEKIDEYYPAELVALVRWILSDGLLRTDDQIVDAMIPELGFQKRGKRIVEAITRAIQVARRPPGRAG